MNLLTCSSAPLFGADWRRAHLHGRRFCGAERRQASLGAADLSDADRRGAGLGGANLSAADLRETDLGTADLMDCCGAHHARRGQGISKQGYGTNLRGRPAFGNIPSNSFA